MKKRKITAIFAACLIAIFAFSAFGCGGKEYKRKELYYGLGEVSAEFDPLVEKCDTNDYLAEICGGFGVSAFRIWMTNASLFMREQNSDKVSLNPLKTEIIHDLCKKLKANGVQKIVAMSSTFIYPYDYSQTTNSAVPDPEDEREFYERFLNIVKDCYALLAAEFDEIDYFEAINEPDLDGQTVLHKNGYTFNASSSVNANFLYTYEESARIAMDIQYYATEGIKTAGAHKKMLSPAMCAYTVSKDYLEECYKSIKSKTLPTGRDYSVTDPDSYFEILNWHPYVLKNGAREMDEGWAKFQREFYNVAIENEHTGVPVWFTEIGFSYAEGGEDVAATRMQNFLRLVKHLDFVETIFVFRINELYSNKISTFEDQFGLLRSVCDPEVTAENAVKKTGEIYFKEINGNASITKLTDVIAKYVGKFNQKTGGTKS